MASVGDKLLLSDPAPRPFRSSPSIPFLARQYTAEIFDGADDALQALEHNESGMAATAFQTLGWLTVLYEELAPGLKATPRVLIVREAKSGSVSVILPLVVFRDGWLRVAEFADLGVSDYGAPILGPAAPTNPKAERKVWKAIRRALYDVDLIRFLRMPRQIGAQPNPLLGRDAVPARHAGHAVIVPDSVDELLRQCGKKFRKEVERCTRVWQKETLATFSRAETPEDIARAYSTLEELQAARHAGDGAGRYVLKSSPYRAFHERLVMDACDTGFSHIFTLEAGGKIAATLFGTLYDDTFTLLRISHAGEAVSHFSPGRLVVVETMRYFVARGVRRFDMGIGEYRFKSDFGAVDMPLFDVVIAQGFHAVPRAALHRLKARIRARRRPDAASPSSTA